MGGIGSLLCVFGSTCAHDFCKVHAFEHEEMAADIYAPFQCIHLMYGAGRLNAIESLVISPADVP